MAMPWPSIVRSFGGRPSDARSREFNSLRSHGSMSIIIVGSMPSPFLPSLIMITSLARFIAVVLISRHVSMPKYNESPKLQGFVDERPFLPHKR